MVAVVAVVDSRNIRGLSGTMLGFPRNPTVSGLDVALGRFGFDVEASYFSVAVPRSSDRKHLLREAGENERYLEYLRRDTRVTPLLGSLRRYGDGTKEEKLVDVLCAIEVVRQAKRIADGRSQAEAVVVVSQDIDLKPGVELALEFGVPVLAISPGAIHNRGIPYIAISEPPLAEIVAIDRAVPVFGQELRRILAQAAERPAVDSWEYLYSQTIGREELAVLRHRHGYEGVADASIIDHPVRGALHDLGTIGIATDLPTRFPRALLGLNAQPSEDLITATVVGRFSPFSANVGIHRTSNQVTVDVPNSYLTPGTQVLLQSQRGTSKPRFVGAVEEPPLMIGSGGREMAGISVVAIVTGAKKGHAVGEASSEQIEVFIPKGGAKTEIGGRYLVSIVAGGRDPSAPFVAHLASTKLP